MEARVTLMAVDEKTEEDFRAAIRNAGLESPRRFEHGLRTHVVLEASPENIRSLRLPTVKSVCENR